MNVVAVILARGGSKRLPGKNTRLLCGKPLIAYTIKAAKGAKHLSRTIVSTDDPDIARIATEHGAEVPFLRPLELAQDETPSIDPLVHAIDWLEQHGSSVDAVVLLQPTSPLRQSRHIDDAIELFRSTGVDTITAVSPTSAHPYWCWKREGAEIRPFFSPEHVETVRQNLPSALIENGAIYVVRRDLLLTGTLYGDHIAGYLMDDVDAFDIDTHEDFDYAELLIKRRADRG